MGLLGSLFGRREKAPAQPVRAIVATRQESLAAQRRRTSVMLQLAVYAATTTPEQRKADTDAFFASRLLAGKGR